MSNTAVQYLSARNCILDEYDASPTTDVHEMRYVIILECMLHTPGHMCIDLPEHEVPGWLHDFLAR